MEWSKKSPAKGGFQRISAGVFSERRIAPARFNWSQVDRLTLLAAFSVCSDAGVTMSIAPASGGIGVNVRIYQGDKGDSAIALEAGQLNELLDLVIAKYGSTSEDVKMSLDLLGKMAQSAMPAD